jgi:NAD(P)-dependent dehydrogenase (short-subunit alcohol dehydrogenase family)
MSKKILITGASGGFGKLTVQTLLNKGHSVVASMRGIEGKNKSVAGELKAAGAHLVEIDVTNDVSVDKGVTKSIELLGGLDVLINNAGVGVLGLQEAYTTDDWKSIFDINVFGVQRLNRAVLPHFRKNQSGLVVFVSSLLGRISLPFYGPYQATKWAMEAMAENYRVELSGFGVDCVIVEPGGFPTTFVDNLVRPSDTSRQKSYGPMAQAPQAALDNFENVLKNNPQQDPQNVANTIAELIDTSAGHRKFRTTVDNMGMGDPIVEYNGHLEKIMNGIYNNFGMADMLKVKV